MEYVFEDIRLPRAAGMVSSQALAEGDIPFPEGSAGRLMCAQGEVELGSALAGDGSVTVEGRVRAHIMCSGEDAPFCFVSSAAFRHEIPCAEALPGLECICSAQLSSFSVKQNASLALSLYAVADITCRLVDRTVLPAFRETGCEVKTAEVTLCTGSGQTRTLELREEFPAGEAAAVLCAQGCLEADAAAGRGVLAVDALCRGLDGRLLQRRLEAPFEYASAGAACATVSALNVRCVSEFDIIVVEAQLLLWSEDATEQRALLPLAAYRPGGPYFSCVTTQTCFIGSAGTLCRRHTLTETLSLPDGTSPVCRPLGAFCRAAVTAKSITDGRLFVEGLLFTHILYEDESGTPVCFYEDVPFCADFACAGDAADVSVCALASLRGGGLRPMVDYTLFFNARLFTLRTLDILTAAEPACAPLHKPGITAYYAAAGETLFDAAMRFDVTVSELRELNPAAGDALAEGERLVVITR